MFQSDYEEYYRLNRDKYPDDFNSTFDRFMELRELFVIKEPEFLKALHPPLVRLMEKHFPLLCNNTDALHRKHMADINDLLAHDVLWKMFFLLSEQQKNIDLHSRYPKLEEWRDFYGRPGQPGLLTDKDRHPLLHKTDEEWQRYKEGENKLLRELHREQEERRQAVYDIVQPLLFSTLPGLQDLQGDYWIIYALVLRDAYEQWNSFTGRIEVIIENRLPDESFYWENGDFHKALREKMRR